MKRYAMPLSGMNELLHDCGQPFVLDQRQVNCPWCQVNIEQDQAKISGQAGSFHILVPRANAKFSAYLEEGKPFILGQENLGSQFDSISRRHLQIMRLGDRLHLQHIGRHPSALKKQDQWYRLDHYWAKPKDFPLALKLADLEIEIKL